MNLHWLFRALALGAIILLSSIGQADSLVRPPAGELSGRTRAEVVAVLGQPTSFAASNDREILFFPLGRVDLEGGKVVSADEGVRREYQRQTKPAPAVAAERTTIAPSQLRSHAFSAEVKANPSSTSSQQTVRTGAPARTGLESFYKMIGAVAVCTIAVGLTRIVAVRRVRRRAESRHAPASPRPALGTKPTLENEGLRPGHDHHDQSIVRSTNWSLSLLRALEWKRFEDLTAAYFAEVGFIARTTCTGADGGVDVRLFREGQTTPEAIVQCKAWARDQLIGVKLIRELFGVMAAEGVARGVFATTSGFTDEAQAFARGKALDLIDGELLLDRILALPSEAQARLLARATEGDYTTPSCPTCGTRMVLRTANRGRSVGDRFWGCTNYPRCRQMLRLRSSEN